MPWKECHAVDERLRFIARRLDGEKMAPLCAEFGISRKTGYKIFERYQDCGVEGLTDRSRRPYRHANQLPMVVEKLIVALKREYPSWGAPKIRERLRRRWPGVRCPAISTVHAVLDRHGLVTRRGPRRRRAEGTPLSWPDQPNALWCADYKGEFMLADRRYCYPLTITDFATRYLLRCEALSTTQERYAFTVFEQVFKEFGLPAAIRTDNGVPFASPNALYGLSRLSVWWLRLGIQIERIKPGHPEQNGRHERMHLTLKTEATKPAAAKLSPATGALRYLPRSASTTSARIRPWACACPASSMRPRRAPIAASPTWPIPSTTGRPSVTHCGRLCFNRRKVNLSQVFAGQQVGVRQVTDRIWLVSFMDYDLGYFDDETCRLEPIENPFGPKVLPMSPE